MRLTLASLVMLAAALAVTTIPVQAKLPVLRVMTGDNSFLFSGLDLNDQDRSLAGDAVTALLADAAAVQGTQVTWSNAQSGNSGAVVLVKSFDYDGLPCRGLEHRIKQRGMADQLNFRVAKCQTAEGTWKTL